MDRRIGAALGAERAVAAAERTWHIAVRLHAPVLGGVCVQHAAVVRHLRLVLLPGKERRDRCQDGLRCQAASATAGAAGSIEVIAIAAEGHLNPALQEPMPQAPLAHTLDPFATAPQALPHAPQLLVVFRLVSQPLAALPSQFPKPAVHAIGEHTPATHALVVFGVGAQTAPHAPQLPTFDVRSTHALLQFVWPWGQTTVAQSAPVKPALQTHAPDVQAPLPEQVPSPGQPLTATQTPALQCSPFWHALPHAPQFALSIIRFGIATSPTLTAASRICTWLARPTTAPMRSTRTSYVPCGTLSSWNEPPAPVSAVNA